MHAFLLGGLLVLVLAASLGWYSLWLPGRSAKGELPPPTEQLARLATALRGHVVAIASKPHNLLYPAELEQAADYIAAHLRRLGYEVKEQRYVTRHGLASRNIWVEIAPMDGTAGWLVVGAHYDSAGNAPGANDNGSGVAAVLELARLFENWTPERRGVILVLFANEEPPYFRTDDMGSRRFAKLLADGKRSVSGMMCLETIGWFDDRPGSQEYPPPLSALFSNKGDFLAFVAMPGSRTFMHRVLGNFREVSPIPTIGGVAPSFIPGIDWSDHASFAAQSMPAVMITDTAPFRYPHYHEPTDTPDKLDYIRLAHVTLGVGHAVRRLAK